MEMATWPFIQTRVDIVPIELHNEIVGNVETAVLAAENSDAMLPDVSLNAIY
ncbi:MAG: hypothetical protein KC449_21710 [Anaerolineales bacterium]|nr:hypothetical protein [Anaerolineales bacterium]